jgi:hypothetical protein
MLYNGYVLCVTDDRRTAFERNPLLAAKIQKVLAPGVYFCAFETDAEAAKLIEKTMATCIGKTITTPANIEENAEFEAWNDEHNPLPALPGNKGEESPLPERQGCEGGEAFIRNMQTELRMRDFSAEQYDVLLDRIKRKLILNAEQFRPESVRAEKTEAAGIDFLGKLHFIEDAITKRELLEFALGQEGTPQARLVIGTPVWLKKQSSDSFVTVVVEPAKSSEQYSVAKLRSVRKIRSSIFQDFWRK